MMGVRASLRSTRDPIQDHLLLVNVFHAKTCFLAHKVFSISKCLLGPQTLSSTKDARMVDTSTRENSACTRVRSARTPLAENKIRQNLAAQQGDIFVIVL